MTRPPLTVAAEPDLFTAHPDPVSGTSQAGQILAYLKAGYPLTPLQALQMFGCLRLGARIADLKAAGYRIVTALVEVDGGKRVAEYRMVG